MKPLTFITQVTAIAGFALTGYGFAIDEFGLLQSFVLTVFFFWAHIYATTEMTI